MITYILIYYAHLAYVRFEHSLCRGSLMTSYIDRQMIDRQRDRQTDRQIDRQIDIDIDICPEEKEEVIDQLRLKYYNNGI